MSNLITAMAADPNIGQVLGPLATIFAAVVAAIITATFGYFQYKLGASQKEVAASQRDIAYDKLKLDLFEKRYKVYQSAFFACRAMILPNDYPTTAETFNSWTNIMDEAVFLFPASVTQLTEKISALSREWLHFKTLETPNLRMIVGAKLEEEQARVQREAAEIFHRVVTAFEPELSFRQMTQQGIILSTSSTKTSPAATSTSRGWRRRFVSRHVSRSEN